MSIDPQRGCLLGLAIGDALNAAVEFKPPDSFEPVVDYRGGGPHRLDPGEWIDHTSTALASADSITKVDVPKDGCPSPDVSDDRLKENVDDKKPRQKKTAGEAAK